MNEQKNKDEKTYKYNGKEYVLVDELVKGGCQGCAFYNKLDCASVGRTKICNSEKKIFMRKLKND